MTKTRVQIPAYTDRWMMGDRYGTIIRVSTKLQYKPDGCADCKDIAHVKLDKSGKTIRVRLDDCTEV